MNLSSRLLSQTEPWRLNAMKTCLEHKLLGKTTRLDANDVKLVVEGLKTNPLVPMWHLRHIIPFVTEVPQDQTKRRELFSQLKETFKQNERDFWITILLIHAPIEESEKKRLIALIEGCKQFEQAQKEKLTFLVDQTNHNQDYIDGWNKALTCLEGKQKEDISSLAFLDQFVAVSEKGSEDAPDLETVIWSAENIQNRDKDTLLSLVNRRPRFTPSRREEIASWFRPRLESKLETTIIESIDRSKLSKQYQVILKNCVTTCQSMSGADIAYLKKTIESDRHLKKHSGYLLSFLDRSKMLSQSDRILALSCGLDQSEAAKRAIPLLFDYFGGTQVDDTDLDLIRADVQYFKTRLNIKQKRLIKHLHKANLSWKDLATLLCLPNGVGSTRLPGFGVLYPPKIQGPIKKRTSGPSTPLSEKIKQKVQTKHPRKSPYEKPNKVRLICTPSPTRTKRMVHLSDHPPKEPTHNLN
ncbi:hypothetical protein BLNAU_13234 [Blattamonas nauphoetae]|uniref:Uncharacterized protein n=1 Tax=Blattamonas nauphoetae TaxID=2049346 RepID=A0ABQ9XM27_9EUKA|nr:hypothetical protein BLNAU_13234 [Blattamonas nauphoetae]